MLSIEKDLKDTLSMKETATTFSNSQVSKYDKSINTNYENLSIIFTIFKYLILIADQTTLEILVSGDIFLITFGALEHDFDSISSQKFIRHRVFLKEKSKFKNPFRIEDPKILEKIHLNYRLIYLRDIAIGRFIEDNTMKHIALITNSNYGEIINYILLSRNVLKNVNEKLNSYNFEERNEAVEFLVELINIGKEMYIKLFIVY